ncbi:family 20 glycosylhydrolase [Microbacterium sp.]|uniref:family 20 glycosylhydrolase n=1 Tax=Microbacterium sp. TaxID=51671 RepID=UPI003342161B
MRRARSRRLAATLVAFGVAISIGLPLQLPSAATAADGPVITDPGFESGTWAAQTQHAHAEIVQGGANGSKHSVRIGLDYEGDSPVPVGGNLPTRGAGTSRGSVNQQITNVKPDTEYEFSVWIKGKGIRWGVFDLESKGYYTGSTAGGELSMYAGVDSAGGGTQWEKKTSSIVTGPRTTELNGFCILTDMTGPGWCDEFSLTEIGPRAAAWTPEAAWTERPSAQEKFPVTVPEVQQFRPSGAGEWKPRGVTRFVVDEAHRAEIGDEVQLAAAQFVEKGVAPGLKVAFGKVSDVPADGVFFTLGSPDLSAAPAKARELSDQAYSLAITDHGARVTGGGEAGALYGAMTLLQGLQGGSVPTGEVIDWTDQELRGLQVDSARRYYSLEWFETQVRELSYLKMNTLAVRVKDNEGLRVESDVLPRLVDRSPDGGSWTKAQVAEFVKIAKKYHVQVIPEVDVPEHSDMDRRVYPEYFTGKVWDFTRADVRDVLERFIRETGETFDSEYVHIGADEVTDRQTITPAVTAWMAAEGYPDSGFLEGLTHFANLMNAGLKADGRKTMLWNDEMNLRTRVPLDKDISIVYWANLGSSSYADQFADADYPIVGSSSDLYHDIWPPLSSGQYKKETINGPPLQTMLDYYGNPWVYPTASFGSIPATRPLTTDAQKAQSLGQLFPIWDDAMGWPPEQLVSKSLFPRLRIHAQTVWNSPRSITSYPTLDPYLRFYGEAAFSDGDAKYSVSTAAVLRPVDGFAAEVPEGQRLAVAATAVATDGTTTRLEGAEVVVTSDNAADEVSGGDVVFHGTGPRVLTVHSAGDPTMTPVAYDLTVTRGGVTPTPTPTPTPTSTSDPSGGGAGGDLATTGGVAPWAFAVGGVLLAGAGATLAGLSGRKRRNVATGGE